MNEKTRQALCNLVDLEETDADKEILADARLKLGKIAIEEGDFNIAHMVFDKLDDKLMLEELAALSLKAGFPVISCDIFGKLKDKKGLVKSGHQALEKELDYTAIVAFREADDYSGLKKAIELAVKLNDFADLESAIKEDTQNKISRSFRNFISSYGVQTAVAAKISETINAANQLANKHDHGIGIAKSGLWPAYIFSLFGLPLINVESHKKGKSADFKWLDSPEIKSGSRILIFDNDTYSGRTLNRVVREIQEYSPKLINVYLSLNCTSYCLSNFDNKAVKNIFTPKDMKYDGFFNALLKLEERVK